MLWTAKGKPHHHTILCENDNGRRRVVINNVSTDIHCARFPIKRCVNEAVSIEADIYADGHDVLACRVLYQGPSDSEWQTSIMEPLGNDRWLGEFVVREPGYYTYTLMAWVDHFESWREYFYKKYQANQDVATELQAGASLVWQASKRAPNDDARRLKQWAQLIEDKQDLEAAAKAVWSDKLSQLMNRYPPTSLATHYPTNHYVWVDRQKANFSAWYELLPRSWSDNPDQHGTFADVIRYLPYIADMGFDVLYLPPIHPIGHTHRKGKNNQPQADYDDVGSPWGIGNEQGGHKAIHPQLGSLQDFQELVRQASNYGMEVALDIALQCSPDHPYVHQHPEWFNQRPDGSLRHAENPPKKYEDIYPIYFETEYWHDLWQEIKSIFDFWIEQGVKIFRVDNPHTKPFAFWEWLIETIHQDHPEVIFLAEAFTRPKVMYHLAKLGFTQSYTYFCWRNTPGEMQQYVEELTQTSVKDYFRPNFWPNTPDILHAYLQQGGKPAFIVRLTLAATLSTNYGIYGPAFELCVNTPKEHGSEEYLNSEKYEIKQWDLNSQHSLKPLIKHINQMRHHHEALQQNTRILFHDIDNPQFLCYSKWNDIRSDVILVVINFDVFHRQTGWIHLNLRRLGIGEDEPFTVKDLIDSREYVWRGAYNYVALDPHYMPVHIFHVNPTG